MQKSKVYLNRKNCLGIEIEIEDVPAAKRQYGAQFNTDSSLLTVVIFDAIRNENVLELAKFEDGKVYHRKSV